MQCTECRSELPSGARFCIECRAPVVATGATERLAPDKPLGRLNGEWVYEYSYKVWSDPNFITVPDWWTFNP